MVKGDLEQRISADDVGFYERSGAVDGSIDMAFSCQMHHDIRAVIANNLVESLPINDVGADECETRIVGNGCERVQIAGISELVDHQYAMRSLANEVPCNG